MTHPKHADSSHEILDVIRYRWSPRAFDPARTVARDDLARLFEAARWAPSSFNEQPWRFVVAERSRSSAAFGALLETLEPANRSWAQHAPILVLVTVSLMLSRTGSINQNAWYDAGQAVGYLTLQATSLDIAIRQMEGFDRGRAAIVCDVPGSFQPGVIMAIGYAGEPELLQTERDRLSERRPRSRQPLSDFVFQDRWGQAFGGQP